MVVSYVRMSAVMTAPACCWVEIRSMKKLLTERILEVRD